VAYPEFSEQENPAAAGTRRRPAMSAGLGVAVLAGIVVAAIPATAPGALSAGTTGLVPAVHVLAGPNTTCCGQQNA
jgi:hypothetical protein